MVAAGSASANVSRAVATLVIGFPQVTLTRLTLRGIKHDKNIVMLARILNLVETNKSSFGACPACHPTLGLLDLALAASFIYRQIGRASCRERV